MRIENMVSSKGNRVANQFIITDDVYIHFQSYGSIIIRKHKETGNVYLDKNYWDYSTTTGKYRNQFLGETKKETEKKIKNGTYQLTNLN